MPIDGDNAILVRPLESVGVRAVTVAAPPTIVALNAPAASLASLFTRKQKTTVGGSLRKSESNV